MGKQWKQWLTLFFWVPKSLQMVTAAMKLKDEADINNPNERVEANDYTGTSMVPGHEFDKDPTIHVLAGSEESYIFLDVSINKFNSLAWVMAKNNGDVSPYMMGEGENKAFSTYLFAQALVANKELREKVANDWFNGIVHTDWAIKNVALNAEKDYVTVRLAYQGDKVGNANTVNAKALTEGSIDIRFMKSFNMPTTVTQEMIAAGVTEGNMKSAFNTENQNFVMNFTAYAIQADTLTNVDAAYKAMFGVDPMYKMPAA